ncbi:hypothetical protein BV25DRAFT_1003551 [Artomyces pyxidatus]|uniref:Uncharacterized protein n=1 Tax=Artomyces pyxidatus TaxID=48021 RepID=A0ACB8SW10_9AGAM|nr:hypothetical protein BV25DRAFT_1003551 [Artomyces pyxidatus]
MQAKLFSWAVFVFASLPCTLASFYVINPTTDTVCHAGQPCTVQWLDDGEQPTLQSIAACTVALYSGDQHLLQQIEPVDVSVTHSLTFTPNAQAGPNSNTYYVGFTSTTLKSANSSQQYQGFTPTFSIDGMTGSFDTAIPSLTSSIPIPASVSQHTQIPVSTVSISGSATVPVSSTKSTSSSKPPSTSSQASTSGLSRLSSSAASSTSPISATPTPPATTAPSNAACPTQLSRPVFFFVAIAALIYPIWL